VPDGFPTRQFHRVRSRRRADRDVHAPGRVDLVVIDFRKDQLGVPPNVVSTTSLVGWDRKRSAIGHLLRPSAAPYAACCLASDRRPPKPSRCGCSTLFPLSRSNLYTRYAASLMDFSRTRVPSTYWSGASTVTRAARPEEARTDKEQVPNDNCYAQKSRSN
jgi:hypothetical protein